MYVLYATPISLLASWIPIRKTNTCDQDIPYLDPIIRGIESERTEREDLESMVIKKRAPAKPTAH